MEKHDDVARAQPARRTWKRPQLKYIGDVGDVLKGGGGKLSITGADPGDVRKEKGNN